MIGQDTPDHLSNPSQAFAFILMLSFEVADAFGRDGVARLQFVEDHVLFRMMAAIGIVLEISDDRLYNFIIGPLIAVEDTQFLLQNEKQFFDVPVFFA
jgi:hypothetical protein